LILEVERAVSIKGEDMRVVWRLSALPKRIKFGLLFHAVPFRTCSSMAMLVVHPIIIISPEYEKEIRKWQHQQACRPDMMMVMARMTVRVALGFAGDGSVVCDKAVQLSGMVT
jgi:hypothetical protein